MASPQTRTRSKPSNPPLVDPPLSLSPVEFDESAVGLERNGLLDHHVFRMLLSVASPAGTNATDDGGGATDDGVLSTKSQSSISQYGALLQAVVGELSE